MLKLINDLSPLVHLLFNINAFIRCDYLELENTGERYFFQAHVNVYLRKVFDNCIKYLFKGISRNFSCSSETCPMALNHTDDARTDAEQYAQISG